MITEDRRVFEFVLSYHRTGDPEDAVITRWDDLTETWRGSAFAREITVGLDFMNKGKLEC